MDNSTMKIGIIVGQKVFKKQEQDNDLQYLQKAAKKLNVKIQILWWQNKQINWKQFNVLILRSVWDYVPNRNKFIQWCKEIQKIVPILNNSKIIQKNTDKIYLKQLNQKGLPSIPTIYAYNQQQGLLAIKQTLKQQKFIAIKPTISAGAKLTYKTNNIQQGMKYVNKILKQNKIVMIQPYLQSVQIEGQKSIIIINGNISHVVRRKPALAPQTELTQKMRDFVRILQKIDDNFNQYLYARVDLTSDGNKLLLMELQLTEPSLFLQFNLESAQNLILGAIQKIKRKNQINDI